MKKNRIYAIASIVVSAFAIVVISLTKYGRGESEGGESPGKNVLNKSEFNDGESKLLKSVAEMRKQAEEEGRVDTSYYATYSLVGIDGKIPTKVAELAKLDSQALIRAQNLMDRTWENMSKLVKENLIVENVRGEKVYHIRAFPREGEAEIEFLQRRFKEEFGEEIGEILSKGVNPHVYFGGFGSKDVSAQFFSELDPGGNEQKKIKLEFKNAKTGAWAGTKIIEMQFLKIYFGSAFDDVMICE